MSKTELIEKIEQLEEGKLPRLEALVNELMSEVDAEELKKQRLALIGSLRGKVWMADDFHETPPEFEPYI